jgi:hypothetical protein
MANQGKLFRQGLRPVYRSKSNMKWKRVHGSVDVSLNGNGSSSVTWSHKFKEIEGTDEEVFFAYTYPYSYTESLNKTQNMLKRFEKSENIYMHRELLFHSLEGREMELITLTSNKGKTQKREEGFSEDSLLPKKGHRPFKFNNKTCIFLTSRVHPGETPASYVLNGILNFLTGKNS